MRRPVRIVLERFARLTPSAVIAIASLLLAVTVSASDLIRLDFRFSMFSLAPIAVLMYSAKTGGKGRLEKRVIGESQGETG
jgi:hypothetical protein